LFEEAEAAVVGEAAAVAAESIRNMSDKQPAIILVKMENMLNATIERIKRREKEKYISECRNREIKGELDDG
jgi:hypothetical protein